MDSKEWVSRLFLKHQYMLMDYIRGLVRDVNDAEDVFQEVGVTILSKSSAPSEECEFAAWCRAIARNVVLHYWRTKRRSRVVADRRFLDAVDLAYREAEPGLRELNAAKRRALADCLGELPRRSREVLDLRYHQGRTSTEIGASLRRTAEAMRMMFSRIRKQLRSCIERRLAVGGER